MISELAINLCTFILKDDEFGHRCTAAKTLEGTYSLSPVGDYNHEHGGRYVMGALVPVVEGIDDFPESLGLEVHGRDQKEENSIHGGVDFDRDMIVDTC
jgi:hypothetical protein